MQSRVDNEVAALISQGAKQLEAKGSINADKMAATLTRSGLLYCAARFIENSARDILRQKGSKAEAGARGGSIPAAQNAALTKAKNAVESQIGKAHFAYPAFSKYMRETGKARSCGMLGCPVCKEYKGRFKEFDSLKIAAQVRLNETLSGIIDEYATTVKMEWTQKLLGTSFALRDGSLVTWGLATVKQHEERIAIFQTQAEAGVRGAASHTQAIQDLKKSGAKCLADMTSQRFKKAAA